VRRLAATIVALIIGGGAWAQESVLPTDQEIAILQACAVAAHREGRDLAFCRGILAGPCLNSRGGIDSGVMDRAICLQYEEFGWKWLLMKAVSHYADAMEGREGFSREEFLGVVEANSAALRDQCFRFPKGQELRVLNCMTDGEMFQLGALLRQIDALAE